MKILIIGSDYNWSIERIYKKELLKLGHEVLHLPVQNWFYDYYYKSNLNKIFCRLGFSNIEDKIQQKVLDEIKNLNFDVIWVFKGMELTPKTIVKLRNQTQRLINFNPDNPFIFSGKGSGNKNVTKSISLYDEHYTYDYNVKFKIETQFKKPCTILPFGFDPEVISLDELNDINEINAVCFVGNPDSYRTKVMLQILDKGLPLHVYGHSWSKHFKHENLIIHDPVYEKDYFKILRKYRVQLNIMRLHNLDSHNMRSIEIPGCGGIMLAPTTIDHNCFFQEGKEAFFYQDIDQLISKADYLLKLDSISAQNIRNASRQVVLKKFVYSELVSSCIHKSE